MVPAIIWKAGQNMKVIDFPKIKVSCEQCSLTELCLPRGLSESDLETLDRMVKRPQPVQKNSIVFRCGDRLDSLFAVRSGTIKLCLASDDGEEQILGFYLPGEIFGLDAIESGRHTCTATALETSSVCAFPYANLSDICRQIPTLHEQLMQLVGKELNNENRLLLTIGKKSAEERLATFLLSLSSRFSRLGYSSNEFRLTMSRQEIGNYLGLTIETVSRILTRFQKAGLIAIERRFVTILDMPALRATCGHGVALRTRSRDS
jgi:CRP/FNR family transcriptional regulator